METAPSFKYSILNRSNLRNVIIILSCASTLYYPVTRTAVAISLFLLFAGSLLHFFVKGVLVRNTVLCKDGIYRLTRHPYYTSNYLIDVSLCLLSGNQYLLVAYPFLFFWAYGPTFRKEEAHLMTLYPDEYHRYGLETPQVLPDTSATRHWKRFLDGFLVSRVTPNELVRILRFWTVALLLLLVRDLRKEGLGELFSTVPHDRDVLIFAALIIVLMATQLIIGHRARKNGKV